MAFLSSSSAYLPDLPRYCFLVSSITGPCLPHSQAMADIHNPSTAYTLDVPDARRKPTPLILLFNEPDLSTPIARPNDAKAKRKRAPPLGLPIPSPNETGLSTSIARPDDAQAHRRLRLCTGS